MGKTFRSGPYGYTMENGLNFRRSPILPTSRLAKTINYLRLMHDRGIDSVPLSYVQDVLGIDRTTVTGRTARHWGRNFFRLAKLSGMVIVVKEKGKRDRYALGPASVDVVTS